MIILQMGLLAIWLVISTYYIPYSLIHKNLRTLKFLTVALMLQNLMSLFASNTTSVIISQYIILYKEIILWGTVVFVLITNFKIKKSVLPMLVFIMYVVFCFARGDSPLYTKLVCFRQIMTHVILMAYGRCLRLDDKDMTEYLRFVVKLGVFQATFGFIELFLLGDQFWLSINISKLFETKGFTRWALDGLPGNYYSADFYHIIGRSIRRLVGITTDPLLTAHFLALCVVILLFTKIESNKLLRYTEIIVMSVAVVLTISKGAILIIGIAYTYKLWIYNRKLSYFAIGAVAAGVFLIIRTNLFRTVAIHMSGFSTGLSDLSLFGGGIGTAGNLASLSSSSSTSGESFFGMILGQMGIIGLVLFVGMIYKMSKSIVQNKHSSYVYAIAAYVLAVMVEAIVSESAINFVGSGCSFIILGFFTKQDKNSDSEIEEVMVNESRHFDIS